ncbi:MAG: FAD-binding oxidoreductase, partial [Candidatus Eremiobacteraeota bacterium]|nr:FAD-binding oxidoreductase [Candidatus Eremiobacteraeota bacterium]
RGAALLLAANSAELAELTGSAREQAEDGFDFRLMGAGAASNYVPVGECEGASFLSGAACFEAAGFLGRLAGRFTELGGLLLDSTPVLGLDTAEVVNLSTEAGYVRAEAVVLAAGARSLALVGHRKELLFPLRGQAFVTEPVRQGPRSSVVAVLANRGHEVYRSTNSEAVVVSGINPGSGPAEKTDQAEVDLIFQHHLEQVAARRLSEIARVEVAQRWAEVHTYSVDGLPLIGNLPGQHRVFLAAGFSNRSWSLGVAAARTLAEQLGGRSGVLPPGCSPRRFL